jgi:hypothetical protein
MEIRTIDMEKNRYFREQRKKILLNVLRGYCIWEQNQASIKRSNQRKIKSLRMVQNKKVLALIKKAEY